MARHEERGVLTEVTPKQNVGKTTDLWKSTVKIVQSYKKKNGQVFEKMLSFDVLGEELCDAVAEFFQRMHGQEVVVGFYINCKEWVNGRNMRSYFITLQLCDINIAQAAPQQTPQPQYQPQPQPTYPPINGQPQPQVLIRQGQGQPGYNDYPF